MPPPSYEPVIVPASEPWAFVFNDLRPSPVLHLYFTGAQLITHRKQSSWHTPLDLYFTSSRWCRAARGRTGRRPVTTACRYFSRAAWRS